MKKNLIRNYFVMFFLIYVMYLYFIVGYIEINHVKLCKVPFYIAIPALELITMATIGGYFHFKNSKNYFFTLVYFITPLIVATIYIFQCYAIYISNNYISVLAFANFSSNYLARSSLLYNLIIVMIIIWLSIFFYKEKWLSWQSPLFLQSKKRNRALHVYKNTTETDQKHSVNISHGGACINKKMPTVVLCIIATIYFLSCIAQRESYSIEISRYQSPISTLIKNFILYCDSSILIRAFPINLNKKYIFKKEYFFKDKLPFKQKNNFSIPLKTHPNVIVLFTEGMSAEWINAYGGLHPELTPNIDRFSQQAMIVKNYYNHTAATYSGLRGQMVSGYLGTTDDAGWQTNPKLATKINYSSLPQILHQQGYKTHFFSSIRDENPGHFNLALRALHFDRFYSYSSINDELLNHLQTTAGAVSDKSFFEALISFLKKHENNEDKQPFFIGTYNIGTHAFLDTDSSGIKYKNGYNKVLNRMHNYDHQVGKFFSYFMNSDYAKNTILILTADHATYPDKDFLEVAKTHSRHYFIDKIPLLIYVPKSFITLAKDYDAKGRTSIDFAPSLLHLLGINQTENSFLGHSIFDSTKNNFGVAAIGNQFFLTTPKGVYEEKIAPKKYKKQLAAYINYINYYRVKERKNLIFPPTKIAVKTSTT